MEHIMESIGFMLSKDFKKRTKAEYWQLALRCEKLEEMCRKYEAGELSFTPNCSLTLLRAQLEAMKAYKGCLEERAESGEFTGRCDGGKGWRCCWGCCEECF